MAGWQQAAATGARAIPISSCPYTIMAPGTYLVTQDLTCPGPDPAITVASHVDNVRLVLGGRTLTGIDQGEGLGEGILAVGTSVDPINGLSIKNGTVTGFVDGVIVQRAPGARVVRVTASGNGTLGIYVEDSPNAWIVENTATNNQLGIYAEDCDGCLIARNRANDNVIATFGGGILVDSTMGALVKANTATGNRDGGIKLFGSSTGNMIYRNSVTGNSGSGIDVADRSTGNRLEGNLATGNGVFDLFDRNLGPPCGNIWRNNRFATDNEAGADAGPGAGCIQ
jgi:parallel beta-helix repeat protein